MAGNNGQIKSDAVNKSNSTSCQRPNDDPPEETSSKRRRDDSVAVENNSMGTNVGASSTRKNMKSIADLPPEILRTILLNIASVDLLNCRKINRHWNEISSKIMRERADIQLRFGFDKKSGFMLTIKKRHCEELLINICHTHYALDTKSLSLLVDCLEKSNHFPYTSFRFDGLANFKNKEMKRFMSKWGGNISALHIQLDNVPKDAVVLRELLLARVTNLKKLELQFGEDRPSSFLPFAFEAFRLHKLETLCINRRYRKHSDLIGTILAAATNLKEFELIKSDTTHVSTFLSPNIVHDEKMVDPKDSITAEDLALLQSFKKLHCLRKARIYLTNELIEYWQKSSNTLDLKLHSLALSLSKSIWESGTLKLNATEIINRLLLSSKHLMQEFSVEPLGLLSGLAVPQLRQLRKLEVFTNLYSRTSIEDINVFLHFELADNFPDLKELDIYGLGKHMFLHSMKPMQKVKTLRLFGGESARNKYRLMKATPNATTLVIAESRLSVEKELIDFWAIAKYLPKLESIGWMVCRMRYEDLLHSLDSCITGLPEIFCRKVSAKFFNKDHLTAEELAYYR